MDKKEGLEAEFGYASLESVKAALRVLPKLLEGRQCRDEAELRRRGFIKSYIKRDAVIIILCRAALPGPAHEFYAVLVRGGLSLSELSAGESEEARPLHRHLAEADVVDRGGHFETNSVFVVRERRYGANKGIPAFIRVPSWVWLLTANQIPKLVRDSLFPGFLFHKPPFEVGRISSPRVMPVPDRSVDSPAGGEDHLIERVPAVIQGVGDVFLDRRADGCVKNELLDFSSSVGFFLGDQVMLCTGEKLRDQPVSGLMCSVRPIQQFLRLCEGVTH